MRQQQVTAWFTCPSWADQAGLLLLLLLLLPRRSG
jgi:hypothetical protein